MSSYVKMLKKKELTVKAETIQGSVEKVVRKENDEVTQKDKVKK